MGDLDAEPACELLRALREHDSGRSLVGAALPENNGKR